MKYKIKKTNNGFIVKYKFNILWHWVREPAYYDSWIGLKKVFESEEEAKQFLLNLYIKYLDYKQLKQEIYDYNKKNNIKEITSTEVAQYLLRDIIGDK